MRARACVQGSRKERGKACSRTGLMCLPSKKQPAEAAPTGGPVVQAPSPHILPLPRILACSRDSAVRSDSELNVLKGQPCTWPWGMVVGVLGGRRLRQTGSSAPAQCRSSERGRRPCRHRPALQVERCWEVSAAQVAHPPPTVSYPSLGPVPTSTPTLPRTTPGVVPMILAQV